MDSKGSIKMKRIIQIIALTMLMIIGMTTAVLADGDESDGKIIFGLDKAETFKEYAEFTKPKLNHMEHPTWLFAEDYNYTLWCNAHGWDVDGYMTATEGHYWAYERKTEGGPTAYDPNNPFYWYRRSPECGLVEDYKEWYADWVARMSNPGLWCCGDGPWTLTPYQGDEQPEIDINEATMPGLGAPKAKSIEWNLIRNLAAEDYQDALFVMTQQKVYDNGMDVPDYPENLTQEEKDNAYFTVDEHQAALWELDINIGRGNDKEDRNLGLAAKRFKAFYEAIDGGSDEDKYKDYVKPMWYDEEEKTINDMDDKHVEEIPEVVIDGESYKSYQYNDTKVQAVPSNESYIIGPFVIDYSVDDETLDATDIKGTGKSTDYGHEVPSAPSGPPSWLFPSGTAPTPVPTTDPENEESEIEYTQIKFDAVEKITLYTLNSDGNDLQNIEELGGSFKIAYECKDGEIVKEGKERRIIDYDGTRYYEMADGERIPSFKSRTPFYIVVYRGDMKPEQFKNVYAKIDFQYLQRCEGTMNEYEGKVVDYWYTCEEKPFTFYYTATGAQGVTIPPNIHYHIEKALTESKAPITHTYELHREYSGEYAQNHVSWFHGSFNRIYKTYSIVITPFDKEDKEPPEIEILKQCSECGPLYGAEFDVKINIKGHDIMYNRDIDETIEHITKITDYDGKLHITAEDISQYGVYLETLENATIDIHFTETRAPAGHKADTKEYQWIIEMNLGEITAQSAGPATGPDSSSNKASFVIENHDVGTPEIILEKMNKDENTGRRISVEAFFDIHVSWTRDGGELDEFGNLINLGELIDNKDNVIRGKTNKDGLLKLGQENFDELPEAEKLNLSGYTGALTLDIVEVAAKGGWTVTPDSKDITLIYKDGELINYTRYTDEEVIAHHVYDNPIAGIYNYLKGGDISGTDPSLIQYVEKWATGQMDKTGMAYEDVMGYLVKYIEDDYRDENGNVNIPFELDEWKASTMSVEENNGAIRIIIENTAGPYPELPEVPPKEEEKFLMRVAGNVFLDQRTTKGSEKESNGKLDQGELLIKGIEVTLYDVTTGGLAELVPSDNPDEVRTNPTVTDINGYYEFRGVDPMHKYYVEFKYNGMEFAATKEGAAAEYNSEEWAVTSKAAQEGGAPAEWGTVNPDTPKAYDYYEIEGIYSEIADKTLEYIRTNKQYPADKWSLVSHPEDKEFADKIAYMKKVEVKAYAGYSVNGSKDETYAHSSLGDSFIINEASMNAEGDTIPFAGDDVKLLYPGQLQIHLGLVERPSIDLTLVSDIVDTVVSINKYDTKYDYYKGESGYHQYMFAEDYDYATEEREDGVAWYTEDKVHFYITYEITVTNESSIAGTNINKIVNYYNKNLRFNPSGYETTKGTKIEAIGSYEGRTYKEGNNLGVSAGEGGGKGATDDYKSLLITIGNSAISEGESNAKHIRLTFELVGNEDNAKAILTEKLKQEESDYARSWIIGNYSEIYEYSTADSYLDRDSKPGNFMIKEYEEANLEFQKAFLEYLTGGGEEASRKVGKWLGRMKDISEDDAWYVGITLTNSGYVRELNGNAWEAISDEVKDSLGLNDAYGDRILTLDEAKKLDGIKVELVELIKEGDDSEGEANQITRAITTTSDGGKYKFKAYIAGDYTVRFVYGGDEANTPKSEHSKTQAGDPLPVNGQYYQSTKANPNTNNEKYWYRETGYDEEGKKEEKLGEGDALLTRYSDAYDDAYSRKSQMLSAVNEKVEFDGSQTSSDFDYEGNVSVQSTWHNDPIYAYTSTLELEIEYIRPQTSGNIDNTWYEYKVNNIDFGVTPRAYNDVDIKKWISNIKVYNQDLTGTDQVQVNQNYNEEGKKVDENGNIQENAPGDFVFDTLFPEHSYPDGEVKIEYDQELLQNLRIEVTYKVKVENKSRHEGNVYDKIKYIYENGKVIAVVYYNEETEKLVQYENDELRQNAIVYHNAEGEEYSGACLAGENRKGKEGRLSKYREVTGYNDGEEAKVIKSQITNIVDYVNKPFGFVRDGVAVNENWDFTSREDYVSSRENYNVTEDGDIAKGRDGNNLLDGSTTPIRYTHEGQDGLYAELEPGETRETELILTTLLNTGSSESYDNIFPNEIEITRLKNTAGKIVNIEGYDMDGKQTSEVRKLEELDQPDPYTGRYTPTISMSKSATITINAPTGLELVDNIVGANLGIVLIALVVLAGGLVLIKKFVLVPKEK